MRIAIVGGGVAGAMLAWRLSQRARQVSLTVYTGDEAARADASGCSGGLVRGFEVAPAACRQAAASLAEVRGSATLLDWTGYTQTGSVYLRGPDPADLSPSLAALAQALPGSAELVGAGDLAGRYPFRGLPADTVAVVERQAGFISPHRLRNRALAELGPARADIRRSRVQAVTTAPAVRLADGTVHRYDVVVLAAGPWTPGLLRRSGMPGQRLRTKHIQYSLCAASLPGLGAFVDDTCGGLYGRPGRPGEFLVGFPCDRWDVDPEQVRQDPEVRQVALAWARRRLGTALRATRTVASSDCYSDDGGLRLRCAGTGGAVFTFSGGSGNAAKTAVAASRDAAAQLCPDLATGQ